MSSKFWIDLLLAASVLPLTFYVVHMYRKGVFREMRAKWLRRKIVIAMQALLPHINALPADVSASAYPLFRLRAELEDLYTYSDVLLAEEKKRLEDFLAKLSTLFAMSEAGTAAMGDMHDVLLLGQRVIQESTELG